MPAADQSAGAACKCLTATDAAMLRCLEADWLATISYHLANVLHCKLMQGGAHVAVD